jgi:hypothetical protein
MARQKLLFVAVPLLVLGTLSIAASSAAPCTESDKEGGVCAEGNIDGGEAVIRGDGRIDGGGNGENGGGQGENGGNGGGIDPHDQDRIDAEQRGGVDGPGSPGGRGYEAPGTCVAGACMFDDVSISDLASFQPTAPTLEMEPDGWMLIGLPANFLAKTGTHVVSGSLFDYPLDVRFTPSSYSWSWGDGSTSRSTVPGASWASLGLPEFSPTPTSHVFETKGVYRISLTVSYTVEFRIDSLPWRSISGTLPGPATIVGAVAGDAKTVLVERECTENPHGPGC